MIHEPCVTATCGCQSCVNEKEEFIFSIYNKKKIYFCNISCKKKFEENPNKFINSDHFKINFEDLNDFKSEE